MKTTANQTFPWLQETDIYQIIRAMNLKYQFWKVIKAERCGAPKVCSDGDWLGQGQSF